ncbi:hypothetical protein AA313_de0209339 [Arthrobotrys entomopaga]|nr:hypothetical protein AA313_de0209339 [Arthrobotrys entomopaga]
MSIETTPNEILSQILSHLPTWGSRYNCLFVSHRFHHLMKPLIYRNLILTTPFLHINRLVTLIRTVRRNSYLGEMAKSLSLGEQDWDMKRNLERIIGSVDINKLFPNLRKVEIYAMTFERGMLLRFFAYCARAKALEEIIVHYPDLVPLVQKMDGVKRFTWGLTGNCGSQVLKVDGGYEESVWIQRKWLASLVNCCPRLEKLTVGCVGIEADTPIFDRIEVEYDASDRAEVEGPFKLEKLKEFEWCAREHMAAVDCWHGLPLQILEHHKDQLESILWDFSIARELDRLFLEELPKCTVLKRLDLGFTGPFDAIREVLDTSDMSKLLGSVAGLATMLEKWNPRGLQEFRFRFETLATDYETELKLLRELQRAKNLKVLEMTWGVPSMALFTNFDGGDLSQVPDAQYWYHDDAKMVRICHLVRRISTNTLG